MPVSPHFRGAERNLLYMTRDNYNGGGFAIRATYHTSNTTGRAYFRVRDLSISDRPCWPFRPSDTVSYDHGSSDPAGLAAEQALAALACHLGLKNGLQRGYWRPSASPLFIIGGATHGASCTLLAGFSGGPVPKPEQMARLSPTLAALQSAPAGMDILQETRWWHGVLALARAEGFPDRLLNRLARAVSGGAA